MTTIAIVGAGTWGTTFAGVCADAGARVRLWARDPVVTQRLREDRTNPEYLPGHTVPQTIEISPDVATAVRGADIVALAVPSNQMRAAMQRVAEHIADHAVVLSLAKGIEPITCLRMSEVIVQVGGVSAERIAVLTGPNLAHEVAARQPCAVVVASTDTSTADIVVAACATPYFLIETASDVIGCEVGGAVKNVVALFVGMAEGQGMGDNTKSALITRGLAETIRLGVALGADPVTFSGLSGAGDLIATCMSPRSRNHAVGVGLGQGLPISDVLAGHRQIAEGVTSCEAILALAQRLGVDMPIVEAVVAVVHDGQLPALIGEALMARERKPEKSRPNG